MRDCAYEASVSLSAFCRVAKGHTALTSECGSMLEEVFFPLTCFVVGFLISACMSGFFYMQLPFLLI